MTAILAAPMSVIIVSGSAQATAPLANALKDPVGLVWRSVNLSGVTATFTIPSAIDTVALYKNNLEATAQIRVRIGSTQAIVDGASAPVDRTFAAWSGSAPIDDATSVLILDTAASGPYVRIDITSSNSDGYVEVQRFIFSKRVEADGIGMDAELGFEDGSIVEDGPGYTTVDQYRVRDTWKFKVDMISEADYWNKWHPFLRSVGRAIPYLFIPDTASTLLQKQAVFGRNSAVPKPSIRSSDFYAIELSLLAV